MEISLVGLENHQVDPTTPKPFYIKLHTNIKSLLHYVDPFGLGSKRGDRIVPDPNDTWFHYLSETLQIPVTYNNVISTFNGGSKFKTPITETIMDHISKYKSRSISTRYSVAIQVLRTRSVKQGSSTSISRKKTRCKGKKGRSRVGLRLLPPTLTEASIHDQPPPTNMPGLEPEKKLVFKRRGRPPKCPRISNVISLATENPAAQPCLPTPVHLFPKENRNNEEEITGMKTDEQDVHPSGLLEEWLRDMEDTPERERDFDTLSQCSLFSNEDDIPYECDPDVPGIRYDKNVDVKGNITSIINKSYRSIDLRRIKSEIDQLKEEGSWLRLTRKMPLILILTDNLFRDRNFPPSDM